MKVFGQHGEGLFASPTAIEDEVSRQYRVKVVGRIEEIKEKFYAISVERRLKHPAVVRISEAARETLFGTKVDKQAEHHVERRSLDADQRIVSRLGPTSIPKALPD